MLDFDVLVEALGHDLLLQLYCIGRGEALTLRVLSPVSSSLRYIRAFEHIVLLIARLRDRETLAEAA